MKTVAYLRISTGSQDLAHQKMAPKSTEESAQESAAKPEFEITEQWLVAHGY